MRKMKNETIFSQRERPLRAVEAKFRAAEKVAPKHQGCWLFARLGRNSIPDGGNNGDEVCPQCFS